MSNVTLMSLCPISICTSFGFAPSWIRADAWKCRRGQDDREDRNDSFAMPVKAAARDQSIQRIDGCRVHDLTPFTALEQLYQTAEPAANKC